MIPAPPPRSKPRRNPSPESRLNHYKTRLSTLNTLLPENLLVNSLRKHDRTAIHSRSKMTEISTLQQWLEAWSLYCSALTQYYPHIAPKLFKYQQFIAAKSKKFKPHAWLMYDTEFRLKLAANKSIKFHYNGLGDVGLVLFGGLPPTTPVMLHLWQCVTLCGTLPTKAAC